MSTPIDLFIGKRIKALRELKLLSVDDVAECLGLTVQGTHHIESGAVRATVVNLIELSQLFKVPLSAFFSSPSDVLEPVPGSGLEESQRGFSGHDDLFRLILAFDAIRDDDNRQTVLDLAEVLARGRIN